MAKIKYKDWNPKPSTKEFVAHCEYVLRTHWEVGYQLTIKQLFYLLVGDGTLKNNSTQSNKLRRTLNTARDAGLLDWNYFQSSEYEFIDKPNFCGRANYLNQIAKGYRQDLWEGQSNRVMIYLDKPSMFFPISLIAQGARVPMMVGKHHPSAHQMHHAAKTMLHSSLGGCISWTVLHLGDLEPISMGVTKDIHERLNRYGEITVEEAVSKGYGKVDVQVRRVGVTEFQMLEMNLAAGCKAAKWEDPDHKARFSNNRWELESMPPEHFKQILKTAIKDEIDDFDAMQRLRVKELSVKESLDRDYQR